MPSEELKTFINQVEDLIKNTEFHWLYENRARNMLNDFIQQIQQENNIVDAIATFRGLIFSWREDPYLFHNSEIIPSILGLLVNSTDEEISELQQLISEVENWLNRNPICSQGPESSQSIQEHGQQDGVQQLSQAFGSQQISQESNNGNQYDPSLGALAYLVEGTTPPHVRDGRNEGSGYGQQTANQVLTISHGQQESQNSLGGFESQPYDPTYDVSSQHDIATQEQQNLYPDHQPSPDWWVDSQEHDFGEDSDADTVDEDYKEGETDAESQTQNINFCSELKFNSLPEGIFDINKFSHIKDKKNFDDNVVDTGFLFNGNDFKLADSNIYKLDYYDVISMVSLISLVFESMILISES